MKQNPLLEKYLKLLLKWNKTYSLTAITDEKEIWIKHFEDSLSPLPFLSNNARLLDIGTGAGFPGIPLKIVRPDLEIVLLDSIQKKIAFCEAVIRELKLEKIEALCGRAEDSKIQKQLGFFDVVISRATASLTDLLELAAKYLKADGTAILMKGKNWKKEETVKTAGWKLDKIFDYELSEHQGSHSLLIFKKL